MNIEVDRIAPCFAKGEIVVDAPLAHVFNIIADINSWPQWQDDVSSAHIEGNPEPGKTFKWKANGMVINSRLHTVYPYSEIGWTGQIWWIKAIHNWYLSSEGNGTRIVVRESMRGLGASFLRKTIEEGIAKSLQELKAKAEKTYSQLFTA